MFVGKKLKAAEKPKRSQLVTPMDHHQEAMYHPHYRRTQFATLMRMDLPSGSLIETYAPTLV